MIDNPHTNIAQHMQTQVAQWQQTGDRRAIFLQCYAMMTGNMLDGVADGRFHDGPWVTHLLHHFANYYFDALAAYDAGDPCTAVWTVAHDAATKRRANVLQNLFLGVNAHINYDLALTVYDLLHEEWPNLSPMQRQFRYKDYCLVNAIIAETIDAVQDEVVEHQSPLMALIDWLGGPVDEFIVAELITHWREDVWRYAQEMLAAPDEGERAQVRQALEQAALRRGQVILGKKS